MFQCMYIVFEYKLKGWHHCWKSQKEILIETFSCTDYYLCFLKSSYWENKQPTLSSISVWYLIWHVCCCSCPSDIIEKLLIYRRWNWLASVYLFTYFWNLPSVCKAKTHFLSERWVWINNCVSSNLGSWLTCFTASFSPQRWFKMSWVQIKNHNTRIWLHYFLSVLADIALKYILWCHHNKHL